MQIQNAEREEEREDKQKMPTKNSLAVVAQIKGVRNPDTGLVFISHV
jgi:hypothetical protein